jgi:NADPH:quinone reductase
MTGALFRDILEHRGPGGASRARKEIKPMKAIRVSEYGGPSVLKLEEVPAPAPGPSQVLVHNHAVGVNPVDTYLRSNTDNRGPKLPYTPGSDAAGVVEAVGSGVTAVKVGDRVYFGGTVTGAYAELSLCEQAHVHPLPANASFAQGAAVNVPYATAYHALFNRGHGQAGETVLVHGASGGVGIGAVQLARARGLTVIGTAGTERGRRLVLDQGAHHVLDHNAPGYLDELMRLTGGQGVDVVLEMLANANLQKDLGILAMRGRIVVIGNRGTVEINARLAMNKDAAILGMALFHASPAQLAGMHAALVEGMRNGTLRPVIGQELPLGQAARAHEAVMEAGHHGKVVLVP